MSRIYVDVDPNADPATASIRNVRIDVYADCSDPPSTPSPRADIPRPSLASRCKPSRQIRYSRTERIRGLFFLSTKQ